MSGYTVPSHVFFKRAKFFECPEASLACPFDKKIVKKKLHGYGKTETLGENLPLCHFLQHGITTN
jgi:hypothetical protein